MKETIAITGFILLGLGCGHGSGSDEDADATETWEEPEADDAAGEEPVEEDVFAETPADGVEDAVEDLAEPMPPGSTCICDSDCMEMDGQEGICVYGICMVRASDTCSEGGSSEECPEHLRCWGLRGHEGSICFPDCDAFECAGQCDSDGSCIMTEGMDCDSACCSYDSGSAAGRIGSPCISDYNCIDNEALCVPEYRYGEPTGFVGGYCIISDCPEPGAACGTGGICVENLLGDGVDRCVGICDGECRIGYECRDGYCWLGCSGDEGCPPGYSCVDGECHAPGCNPCSSLNPYGICEPGQWCDEGTCTSAAYSCPLSDGMEPNDSMAEAAHLSEGFHDGLALCEGDEDWFRISVPAGHITQVTLVHNMSTGDLDMVAYDNGGTFLGSRHWFSVYPYHDRVWETWTETLSFYNQAGEADDYVLNITAYSGESSYSLEMENIPWQDGALCTDAFSFEDCTDLERLILFPFADPDDTFLGDNFSMESPTNYRFLRREALMMIRYGLAEVELLYPGNKLSIWDLSQSDGRTPSWDICWLLHPDMTHDQGGYGIDVAYYQLGESESRIMTICGPGGLTMDGQHCSASAETGHLVDLTRQAYLHVALARNPRFQWVIYDRVIGPLVVEEVYILRDDGIISDEEAAAAADTAIWADAYPYHFNHVHISMVWIP